MTPILRKTVLTVHVTSSVGWLGAVAASVVLAVAGVVSADEMVVRGAYVLLETTARALLVPLSLASLLSGVGQSLGTQWGLFRHYWVVMKLTMNVVASVVLLLYLRTLSVLADGASETATSVASLRNPSPIVHGTGALILLLLATVLSVFKPRGVTRYGRRRPRARPGQATTRRSARDGSPTP